MPTVEGNQLAVFTDARPYSDQQMQRLAREVNFAELPFAGHPVLGTAFVAGAALGSDSVRRVRVGGQAVLVARGEFRLGG